MTESELESLALLLQKVMAVVDLGDGEGAMIEFDMVTRSADGERILLFQFAKEPETPDDILDWKPSLIN